MGVAVSLASLSLCQKSFPFFGTHSWDYSCCSPFNIWAAPVAPTLTLAQILGSAVCDCSGLILMYTRIYVGSQEAEAETHEGCLNIPKLVQGQGAAANPGELVSS